MKTFSRKTELYGPSAFTALIGLGAVVYLYHFRVFPIPKEPRSILMTAITISAITVGFIATAKAILISMKDSHPGQILQHKKLFRDVVSFFMVSIKGLMSFSLWNALGLFLPSSTEPLWLVNSYCFIWLILMALSGALTARTLQTYEAFTKALVKD